MLGLRKYICSQFKPNAAKALYDYFNVKNVLDFSEVGVIGWILCQYEHRVVCRDRLEKREPSYL